MLSTVVTRANFEDCLPELIDVEVIFSTWGMFPLTQAQLDRLPNLRAVFYAAGSVKYFAGPLLDRGVTIVSAWAANAVPVAEFTLGQILLANKGYFRNAAEYRDAGDYDAYRGCGSYGATVSVLGVGQVGGRLVDLLRPFRLRILAFDPFLSRKAAERLGVEKIGTLEEAFARGHVVTNHLADVPQTVGLLNGAHFAAMRREATFINTGRGRTVVHDQMRAVLQARPDLTALLDVTDPEPLPRDSPLWTMPNVHVTSHIAGSIGDEVGRVADIALEEFDAWRAGCPLRYAVTSQGLDRLA
jgi:phosphoglycerate dehydrogenase-like enzyme